MIELVTAILDVVKEALGFVSEPDPEAEMQLLLRAQRVISDEIARRTLK